MVASLEIIRNHEYNRYFYANKCFHIIFLALYYDRVIIDTKMCSTGTGVSCWAEISHMIKKARGMSLRELTKSIFPFEYDFTQ